MSASYGPEVIRLPAGVTVEVGRAAPPEGRLLHPAVSRRHAELRFDGQLAHLRDLGGAAGTRVERVAVRDAKLIGNERVEFGPVAYRYERGLLRRIDPSAGVQLTTSGLAVARDGEVLLSGVSVVCKPGKFVGLLGPSGAGKSTLLHCLAGFLLPASGGIKYDATNLTEDLASCQAQAGYVPQKDIVHLSLTCRENLGYALALRSAGDLSATERNETVARTLDQVGLTELGDSPASQLSGGERKRLNVALELLGRPRILFLDEPTAGLDPASEARLMRALRRLADDGTTVVCSTHVLDHLTLFDQVIVIAGRTVQFNDSPALLLGHFKVSDYPSLYVRLEEIPKPKSTVSAAPMPPSEKRTPLQRQAPLRQCATLLRRGLHLLRRDRGLLAILTAQPLIIGVLINLSQAALPDGLRATLLFAVVAAFWMGLSNTAREVVRERSAYARERLLGVSALNYLGAKVLLFALVGLLQVGLLAVFLRYVSFMSAANLNWWKEIFFVHFVLVLWTTNLCGLLLGLMVSSLVRTQESAVAILPLLVLPQLLISGPATNLEDVRKGHFGSLIVLAQQPRSERPIREVVTEGASLLTYSRPAVSLLRPPPPQWRTQSLVTGWLHQGFLILATATGLLAAFLRSERYWLERI